VSPEVELEQVAKLVGDYWQAPADKTNPIAQVEAVTYKSHYKVFEAQAVQEDAAFK